MAAEETTRDNSTTDDSEGGRIVSLDALHDKLDRLAEQVEAFFSAGGHAGTSGNAHSPGTRPPAPPATAAATAESRRAEIREELAALKRQEQADADNVALQDRIGKLEKAAERPPRQLRRVEQVMRWGRDD